MIDLKRSKKEIKKENQCAPFDGDIYPYGTRLSFNKAQIEKLPALKGVAVGTRVEVSGIGKVIEIRANEREGTNGSEHVEIQIQQIDLTVKKQKKSDEIKNELLGGGKDSQDAED